MLIHLAAIAVLGGCVSDGGTGEGTVGPATSVDTGSGGHPATSGPVVGELVVRGETGVVIEGLVISNPDGDCIIVSHSTDIVIRSSTIGPCAGRAIRIGQSEAVSVEDSQIMNSAAGVYALDSRSISVTGNKITDGGRNPVQFDKVTGAGNTVSRNEIHNQPGSPDTEDSINIYQSSGTTESPIVVDGNLVFNGGSSMSGSGILVGDSGGSHQVVRDNTLINPGQIGIGVAGGQSIRIVDNTVFSESFSWSNVGIYVWDQYETNCGNIEVMGNIVDWHDRDGAPNPWWDGDNCGEIVGWQTNEASSGLRAILVGRYGELFE